MELCPLPLLPEMSSGNDADGYLITNSTIRTVIGRGHSWILSSEDVRMNHGKQSVTYDPEETDLPSDFLVTGKRPSPGLTNA